MRQRKLDVRARVNGDLQLEFEDVALTSYAGLELFARYLRRTGFNTMVREAFAGTTRWGDYGVVATREADLRNELARAPDLVATVPAFTDDIHDLAGLGRISRALLASP